MKKILALITLAATTAVCASAANPNDTVVGFRLDPPMHCHNCENRVKENLRFERGVRDIKASAADSLVTVRFDRRKTDVSKLTDALGKLGYDATPATPKK